MNVYKDKRAILLPNVTKTNPSDVLLLMAAFQIPAIISSSSELIFDIFIHFFSSSAGDHFSAPAIFPPSSFTSLCSLLNFSYEIHGKGIASILDISVHVYFFCLSL